MHEAMAGVMSVRCAPAPRRPRAKALEGRLWFIKRLLALVLLSVGNRAELGAAAATMGQQKQSTAEATPEEIRASHLEAAADKLTAEEVGAFRKIENPTDGLPTCESGPRRPLTRC